MVWDKETSRRQFIKASATAVGLGAIAVSPLGRAFGQDFPSKRINITIPTASGGGADRDVRIFNSVWQKYIKTTFKVEFFPGAAGQVGYETYVQNREPDCYNLIFGNTGPEVIMYVLQKPNYKFPGDYYFLNMIGVEDMTIFVGKNSPIKTIEEMVELGKKRTVNIAVSRLPHPASIGCLSLAEATGAKFNLVPYGGGGPSARAALAGETDAVALPIAQPVRLGDEARTLVVFADKNPVPELTNNAPPVNKVFGTKIPQLTMSRGFAAHGVAIKKYPDRVKVLTSTMKQAFDDPAYPEAIKKAGLPTTFMAWGDQEQAMATAQVTLELAKRYEPLLRGKKKG
jgi:tripartite-type tricarboxylate transporter receptor subunit TctC